MVLGHPWGYEHCVSHFARFNCLYSHHPVHPRFWIEDFREAPQTGKPFLVKPIHGKVSRQSVWGLTVPVIGSVTPTHPAPAIVVTPPGGEPPNRVEAEKHISYALTASSVAPVQDRACALDLVEFAPEALARDVLPTRRNGSMWTQSDYGLTPYWAARVKKQFGKNPDVDAFNRVAGMAQATRWVSPLEDFFSTPADPSKLYWMCPPYHRFSDCVRKIRQEKLRAIVVGPKWTHREWWKPLMEIALQGYHLPGPETKACLYQKDHLTPLPQRGWSTVALYYCSPHLLSTMTPTNPGAHGSGHTHRTGFSGHKPWNGRRCPLPGRHGSASGGPRTRTSAWQCTPPVGLCAWRRSPNNRPRRALPPAYPAEGSGNDSALWYCGMHPSPIGGMFARRALGARPTRYLSINYPDFSPRFTL